MKGAAMVAGIVVGSIFGLLLLVAIGVGIWMFGVYNALVQLRNGVKNAWAQIDVQIKRRHDLIPNVVQTVKGYAAHERQTLEAVIQARNTAVDARKNKQIEDQIKAEGGLSTALARLMVVAEQYPNLKADAIFMSLKVELTETENRISFARQFYNDSVLQYNNLVQMFPSNWVAGMFKFVKEVFFEVTDEAERKAPEVRFV
jgi:LemA protein